MDGIRHDSKKFNIFYQKKEILPGLIVATLIGLASILLSNVIPKLGATTISIFLGMFVGNLFLNQKVFQKDINFQKQIYYHIP